MSFTEFAGEERLERARARADARGERQPRSRNGRNVAAGVEREYDERARRSFSRASDVTMYETLAFVSSFAFAHVKFALRIARAEAGAEIRSTAIRRANPPRFFAASI